MPFHLVGYIAICSMAGYASRAVTLPLSNVLVLAILGSIMVPGHVLWMPKFLILNQVGLVDNHFGIALPISPRCSACSS